MRTLRALFVLVFIGIPGVILIFGLYTSGAIMTGLGIAAFTAARATMRLNRSILILSRRALNATSDGHRTSKKNTAPKQPPARLHRCLNSRGATRRDRYTSGENSRIC
jgi:hypothetical protein